MAGSREGEKTAIPRESNEWSFYFRKGREIAVLLFRKSHQIESDV